ncbi:MAG: ATP-grasp domain-containing protein [Anaerolineaceae bacterium]|nr:ATP-grasp domain-containing protein [Anaerolineaceae bacterium]
MQIALISDPLFINYSKKVNRTLKSHHNLVIKCISSAIEGMGHEVECIEANNELEENLLEINPQIVFNRSIGIDDKSKLAFAPSLLDKLSIPYTGSNGKVCISAFNKNIAKHILQEAGIPTPKSYLIADLDEIQIPDSLSFPLFIKPVKGGCSRGIYKQNLVFSKESCMRVAKTTIEQSHQPALIEEFLTGREFTVGILGNEPPCPLPILEFVFDAFGDNKFPFRSFNIKMIKYKKLEKISCPAILSKTEESKIKELALDTYQAIGCRDYARIDIRFNKDGIPNVLEVNALPSLVPDESSFADMAEAAGISFENLIGKILISASNRHGLDFKQWK